MNREKKIGLKRPSQLGPLQERHSFVSVPCECHADTARALEFRSQLSADLKNKIRLPHLGFAKPPGGSRVVSTVAGVEHDSKGTSWLAGAWLAADPGGDTLRNIRVDQEEGSKGERPQAHELARLETRLAFHNFRITGAGVF
jgi:hypothetical protein